MSRLIHVRRILMLAFVAVCLVGFSVFDSRTLLAQDAPVSQSTDSTKPKVKSANVLFLIGEQEYDTKKTLTKFAQQHLKPLEIEFQFVHAATDNRKKPECHDFPGLVASLEQADLLVVSVRRRFLKPEQLDALRGWIESGKPVVAIRTASHAFAARKPGHVPKGRATWQDFDQKILGGRYVSHYNNKIDKGDPATEIWVAENAEEHSLLEGVVWSGRQQADSHLYMIEDLEDSATVLIHGQVSGQEKVEPVA